MTPRKSIGFTLSELLIALAILGVIATFTIPKVLSSQADTRRKAVIKEVAGMISGAYQAYQQQNSTNAATRAGDLTPYMNYVRFDTAAAKDGFIGSPSVTCTAGLPCLVLHNGAIIQYDGSSGFGSTDATAALWFETDPIAGASGANSPEGVVELWLYTTGRIASWTDLSPNTCIDSYCVSADPSKDPPWWNWN